MSLVGLVQLTERLLNQTADNPQEEQQAVSPGKAAPTKAANANDALSNDTFVASAQNSSAEAGTFQVTQVSLFSAAADIFLARSAAPQAAAPGLANTATATAIPATATPVPTTVAAEDTQTELADLNASLTALGLSQAEITVVDRVAQLIQDFNPASFADIIRQLQLLAQATAAPAAPAADSAPTNEKPQGKALAATA